MRRRLVLFFLCLIACTAAATATAWARHRRRPAAPPTGALLYPLAAAPTISGNFGQYRSDHPHGGVDLWSFLQIGTPVFAAADGEIDYLKCSSTGYGRSLYEKLADGRTAVYGHLSGFAPKIDEVVRREQRRRGEYHVRLDLARRPIGVKRGEVIGYAGDAGTDVPHLHFEIRDRRGLALNPDDAELALNLAGLLIERQQWAEALQLLQGALTQMPDNPEILNNLGLARAGLGQREQAEAAYRAALARDPRSVKIYNNLVKTLLEAGRRDAARDVVEQGLRLLPADPLLRSLRQAVATAPAGR